MYITGRQCIKPVGRNVTVNGDFKLFHLHYSQYQFTGASDFDYLASHLF